MHGGNVWQGVSPEIWLDYSANIRPGGAPEWVRQALVGAMDNLAYYPDPKMARARAALTEYLGLPRGFVLPSAGGIPAIDLAAQLPASGSVVFAPGFGEYALRSRARGKRVIRVPLLEQKHMPGDPAALVQPWLARGCAVWICNPLNPVGCAFPKKTILRLLEAVEAVHGWLIVDEAFIDYCPEHSVVSLIKTHERLLVTGSMTKILGIPGVRLGYLCAQPGVIQMLEKAQLTWELSCFAEAVLCALPQHREDVRAESRRNAARREQLRQGLESLGVFVYPSEAAFLLADFGRTVEPIEKALKKRGILVRTCMDFEGIDDRNHLRLAVKDEASNDRLFAVLREVIA